MADASGEPRPRPKRVAIVQSNYIPWKGYFDLIRRVDEFVLFDDAQFTRRDWRNRNRIKTARGLEWLTIPVEIKGKYHQAVEDTRISDPSWHRKHWMSLYHAYSKSPCFSQYAPRIEEVYQQASDDYLSRVNLRFIRAVCGILGIDTTITWSTDYEATGRKSERLVSLCTQAGATEYLSGPSARTYLDEDDILIVISSDHSRQRQTFQRVPLMILLPRAEYTGVVDVNVQLLDVAPTILSYLGQPIPDWMEGESLLSHESISAERPLFGWYGCPFFSFDDETKRMTPESDEG